MHFLLDAHVTSSLICNLTVSISPPFHPPTPRQTDFPAMTNKIVALKRIPCIQGCV